MLSLLIIICLLLFPHLCSSSAPDDRQHINHCNGARRNEMKVYKLSVCACGQIRKIGGSFRCLPEPEVTLHREHRASVLPAQASPASLTTKDDQENTLEKQIP